MRGNEKEMGIGYTFFRYLYIRLPFYTGVFGASFYISSLHSNITSFVVSFSFSLTTLFPYIDTPAASPSPFPPELVSTPYTPTPKNHKSLYTITTRGTIGRAAKFKHTLVFSIIYIHEQRGMHVHRSGH